MYKGIEQAKGKAAYAADYLRYTNQEVVVMESDGRRSTMVQQHQVEVAKEIDYDDVEDQKKNYKTDEEEMKYVVAL